MLRLSPEQKQEFAEAVLAATHSPAAAEIDAIYARFEVERAARAPVCSQSGRCCRFEDYGHRLFVSTLEVARFWQSRVAEGARPRGPWDGTGCPYQLKGLCSVHPDRPFGCRAYFCDPTSTQWQQEQYERFHCEIRELHERRGVPYAYVEWREALDALGISATDRPEPRRSLPILP